MPNARTFSRCSRPKSQNQLDTIAWTPRIVQTPQQLLSLSPVDLLIIGIYFLMVLGIGLYLKRFTKTGEDFFLAGRDMSAWIAGLSFVAANLGSLELMGWAASAYQYGILATHWYWIGAIPAMLFLGIVMMPFYYISRTHSVPGYLKLRFGEPARALSAISFGFMTVLMSGINMYSMALVMRIILGWDINFSIWVSSVTVAAYVFLGGLLSAIFNEVLQFFLIWLGAIVISILGLVEAGGWHGMVARIHHNFPEQDYTHLWSGLGSFTTNPMGIHWTGILLGLGFVISFGYWTTDFLVVQRVLSAKDLRSAKMAPIIGAAFKMAVPFIVILPGLLALAVLPEKLVGESQATAGAHTYNEVLPIMLARYCGPGLSGVGNNRPDRRIHVRDGRQRECFRYRLDLRHLSSAYQEGCVRCPLRGNGAVVHHLRRFSQYRNRLLRDAVSKHHGLRPSSVQLLYRSLVWHCDPRDVVEACNWPGGILGTACRNRFLYRNVRVGTTGPQRPSLYRVLDKCARYGGEHVPCSLVLAHLRDCHRRRQHGDAAQAGFRVGRVGLRSNRDPV